MATASSWDSAAALGDAGGDGARLTVVMGGIAVRRERQSPAMRASKTSFCIVEAARRQPVRVDL